MKSSQIKSTNSKELVICHMADIHLGYRRYNRLTKSGQNQREADVNTAFREAINKVISIRPDITIIAGDLFHNVRPTNSILTFAFREIRRLAEYSKAPVIVLAGNHEFPRRQETGSALRILSEIENVHVSDQSSDQFNFPELDLSVTCIPHASLLAGTPSARADDRFKFNILAIHAQVGIEEISDFGGVAIDLRSYAQYEWDYIALGHIHESKEISLNAAYSGAIEHTASNIWAGARRNKGFIEMRLPTGKRVFHTLTSPREVIELTTINAEGLDAEEILEAIEGALSEVPGGIEGKIVRLDVNNIPRQVQNALNHKKLRELRCKCLNLSLDLRPPLTDFNTARAGNSEIPRKLNDELIEFCNTLSDIDGLSKENIKGLLLSYLEKVEVRNEADKFEP